MQTQLYSLHAELSASFVPFAGYQMPVRYPQGTLQEHLHCRAQAGFFDISHMGVVKIDGPDGADGSVSGSVLEKLTPARLDNLGLGALGLGKQKYALLTNQTGGIEDDMMVIRLPKAWYLVVNASRKHHDLQWIRQQLPELRFTLLEEVSIIALQGPEAQGVLQTHFPQVVDMRFLDVISVTESEAPWIISRSGYTGEDGFELIIPNAEVESVSRELLNDRRVQPCGLGARDTLRLEAGLSLYGHELDDTITPATAGLNWSVAKKHPLSCPGAQLIMQQLSQPPAYATLGIQTGQKLPMRAHDAIHIEDDPSPCGVVTSGTYSPTLGHPIALARIRRDCLEKPLQVRKRNKVILVERCRLPFVPTRYLK